MDAEAELLKVLSREEIEDAISARIKAFHGLLTRDVAARLVAKEKGLLKEEEREYALAEIPKGARRFGFSATVRKVWPLARYSSGKSSRVVEVSDGSSADGKPLVLWNEDAGMAKGLRSKDQIRVKGAYERGGELHLGYGGALEIARKAPFSCLAGLEDGESVHLRGSVSAIEGEDTFVRGSRSLSGFSFVLSDGKSYRRCVLVEGADRAKKLKAGDEALIEGASVSGGVVWICGSTRMLVRRSGGMLRGTLRMLECEGEGIRADVDGREVVFDRESALRFMGAEVADDISTSTVVSLKKDSLLNRRMAVKIEEKDGRMLVRD